MRKYIIAGIAMVIVSAFVVSTAQAVALDWIEDNKTVVVDHTFQVSKPNKKWDTQTKHYKDPAPVKWVRHIRGANPQMFLRYRTDVKGKTAHHYAQKVAEELQSRGIMVTSIEKKVINNRHVAIVNGQRGDERYMVGVWRHRDIGFQLECVAVTDKFQSFLGDFYAAIDSVKILKEQGL